MSSKAKNLKSRQFAEQVFEDFGDFLYDFSHSILWNTHGAQVALKTLLEELIKSAQKPLPSKYFVPWLIQRISFTLKKLAHKHSRELSTAEKIMLDANLSEKDRLTYFESYFHRLTLEQQMLLLLHYKYKFSLDEIGTALGISVDSLTLRLEQAIRQMQDWFPDHKEKALITLIEAQEKKQLPSTFKSSPLSLLQIRSELRVKWTRWQKTPWYFRSSIELLSVAVLVLLVVVAVPKLRSWSQQKKNQDLELLKTYQAGSQEAEIPRGKQSAAPGATFDAVTSGESTSPAESEEDLEIIPTEKGEINIGPSELWRLNLRTENPKETRNQLIAYFNQLKIPSDTAGLQGLLVPGGIQFNLIIAKEFVLPIKQKLESLERKHENVPEAKQAQQNFAWYRNKSKTPIEPGKTRVVIWLSQI